MDLPLEIADPLFAAEMALRFQMPVSEIGERFSLWEYRCFWPAYFAHEAAKAEAAEQQGGSSR